MGRYGHTLIRNTTELDEAGWVQFTDIVRRINTEMGFPSALFTVTDHVFHTPTPPPLPEYKDMQFRVARVGAVGERTFIDTVGRGNDGNHDITAYICALLYTFPGSFTWLVPEQDSGCVEAGRELFISVAGVRLHVAIDDDLTATPTFREVVESASEERTGSAGFVRIRGDRAVPISFGEMMSAVFGDSYKDKRTPDEEMREFEEVTIPELVRECHGEWFDEIPPHVREAIARYRQGPLDEFMARAFAAAYDASGLHPVHLTAFDDRGMPAPTNLDDLPLDTYTMSEVKAWVHRFVRACFSCGATRVVLVVCGHVRGQHEYVGYIYEPGVGTVLCASQPTGKDGLVGEVKEIEGGNRFFEMKAVN